MTEAWRLDLRDLAARLAALGEGGVACLHQAEHDLPGAVAPGVLLALGRVGLLQALNTKIPACGEHGCQVAQQCRYAADFAPQAERGKSGARKGGRKFRGTAASARLHEHPELLAAYVLEHPAVRWLAARFAERPVWGRFEVAGAWLQAALAQTDQEPGAAAETDAPPAFDGSRRELAACLGLLAALGWVAWEREGLELRVLHRWWETVTGR